jgi:hypothetical protein
MNKNLKKLPKEEQKAQQELIDSCTYFFPNDKKKGKISFV